MVLIIFFALFVQSAFCQSDNIDSLLCKNWQLVSYEESGEKFPPSPEQKNDRMTFYFDHKVKSVETGNIQNGTWEYDSTKKLLTVIDNQTKEKAVLKVLKLTKTECVLEYKDPEGTMLKMHMAPVSK